MHLVCAKISGLDVVQVTLVEPIVPQNLVDSGHLLIFDVTTCFMTLVVLNDDVQFLNYIFNGGTFGTLLPGAADRLLPARSFGGSANTT